MISAIGDFAIGFTAPLRGVFMVARNPRLRWLSIGPVVAAIVTVVFGFAVGLNGFTYALPMGSAYALGALGVDNAEETWIFKVVLLLLWPAAIFALLVFLLMVARIIAVPFYALLAERVMIETGLLPEQPFRLHEWLRVTLRLLVLSVIKLLIFAVAAIVLVVLSLIPGFGVIATIGFLLMAAFDVVDLSFEALQMDLRPRFRVFREEISSFSGLGLVLGLVFLLPGLNFFLLPASVVGASEILRRNQARSGRSLHSTRERRR